MSATVAILSLAITTASAAPHIIMHLVDDWGRNNIGFRGNPEIVSPNMDALAAGGIVFDRFYTHVSHDATLPIL